MLKEYFEFLKNLKNSRTKNLEFEDYKYSYIILKPNSAIHFKEYFEELITQKFEILDCFAIFDYETINMSLHKDQDVLDYIMPLSRFYNDYYSNYAILILIGKRKITYESFVLQVHRFKMAMRDRFHLDYLSMVFNNAKIGLENKEQTLKILNKADDELPREQFNADTGSYMLFLPNEIHCPDASVETTISELTSLYESEVLINSNIIPKNIIESIKKYGTYSFLQDM